MTELRWAKDWIGKANPEDQTVPVLQLRESAQRLSLIRKIKGRIVLTSAANDCLRTPCNFGSSLRGALPTGAAMTPKQTRLLLLLEVAGGERTAWDDYLER